MFKLSCLQSKNTMFSKGNQHFLLEINVFLHYLTYFIDRTVLEHNWISPNYLFLNQKYNVHKENQRFFLLNQYCNTLLIAY